MVANQRHDSQFYVLPSEYIVPPNAFGALGSTFLEVSCSYPPSFYRGAFLRGDHDAMACYMHFNLTLPFHGFRQVLVTSTYLKHPGRPGRTEL